MTSHQIVDVLIVGGGPAGLSAATALARQLATAIVFDSGVYRSRYTARMYNVLTWDHRDPAEFRAKARSDILARYKTITFQDDTVIKTLQKIEGRITGKVVFRACEESGRCWLGRKVVLATGVRDILPDIQGFEMCWGKCIFHHVFYHGFEKQGSQSAGLLLRSLLCTVKPKVQMIARFAKSVTIYTNGDSEREEAMQALVNSVPGISITIEPRKIAELHNGEDADGLLVTLEDGTIVKEGFMVHTPPCELNGPFVEHLGLLLTEVGGSVARDNDSNESSMPGVFVAGDVTGLWKSFGTALQEGSVAGLSALLSLYYSS